MLPIQLEAPVAQRTMCRLFAVLAHAVLAIETVAGDLMRPSLAVRTELVAVQTL